MDQIKYQEWFTQEGAKTLIDEFMKSVANGTSREFYDQPQEHKEIVQAKQALDIFEKCMRRLYILLHNDQLIPSQKKKSLTSEIYIPPMDPSDINNEKLLQILDNQNYISTDYNSTDHISTDTIRMNWLNQRIGMMLQQNKQIINQVVQNKPNKCAKLQYIILWDKILNHITVLHCMPDSSLKCKKDGKMQKIGKEMMDFLDDDRRKAIQKVIERDLSVEIDQELFEVTLKILSEVGKKL